MKNRKEKSLGRMVMVVILLGLILWANQKADHTDQKVTEHRFESGFRKQIERSLLHNFWPYLEYRRVEMYEKGQGGNEESNQEQEKIPQTVRVGMTEIEQLSRVFSSDGSSIGSSMMNEESSLADDEYVLSNQMDAIEGGIISHAVKEKEISMAQYYEETGKIISDFYIVDASTSFRKEDIHLLQWIQEDLAINKDTEGPQILIFNTHSQEAFADSIPGKEEDSIMGVADYLANLLEEKYGYKVYRHRGKYDEETRTGAYNRALVDLERILKEYPSIQVILDIHRDDMKEENHLLTTVDGKPTARFMFFNGISRTREKGEIDYLQNPNLDENLAFSFRAKLLAEEYYPGLTRKNYIHAYRYNLHLLPKSMLIEIGAQNNTIEEEMNACEPLADILNKVLSGEEI